MAMKDWNGDGKNDMIDNFLEYQIYEECTKEDDNYTPSCKNNNYQAGASEKLRAIAWLIAFFLFILAYTCEWYFLVYIIIFGMIFIYKIT